MQFSLEQKKNVLK